MRIPKFSTYTRELLPGIQYDVGGFYRYVAVQRLLAAKDCLPPQKKTGTLIVPVNKTAAKTRRSRPG
jgi:hypothetical protein